MIPSSHIKKELTTCDGSAPRSLIGTVFRFVLVAAVLGGLAFLGTWDKGRYYPLFHSIVDMATVFVAGSVFLVVWNGRRHLDNNYYLIIAIAFLAFAMLDFMHMIGNKGMGVFSEYGNLGPTFYIASRYVLGFSFLLAPLFIKRKVSIVPVFAVYLLVVVLVLLSVLCWRNFPATYVEGTGLTAFKVYSDYAVCLMLVGGLLLLLLNRRAFEARILKIISLSLIFSIATGLAFTLYTDPFGIMNAVGHFFQIASFYLIYLGFVETVLTNPQDILYRNLKQSNENVLKLNSELADLNLSLINDIAARKLVEEALRQSEDRFLLAASAAHTMVYEIDLVTQRVKAMQGLSHLLGYEVSETEMTLEWWNRQIVPEDLPKCRAAFKAMHDNPRDHVLQYRIRHKDGRVLWVEDHATPVSNGARVEGIVGTVIDITARKQAEESLLAANAELTAIANELARSNKDLEQFANIASHDLQEPLRTIKAFLELLVKRLAGKLDDNEKQYLGFVTDGATRMQHLISDLLKYSRSGSKGLAISNISLHDCTEAAVAALGRSIQEASAEIHLGDLPMVKADATWIAQVLQNLISNAIKFRRKDVPPEVSISASRQDGEILVSVKDNGIGIPADQCERVFEMFKRLHRREEYSGTGIGLAICRKVIERHGGRIWVDSKPGEGSSFFFTLPAAEGAPAAAERPRTMASSPVSVAEIRRALETAEQERRQAQAKAESGERMLDALMASVPEGITICDANGTIRMVSRHGQDLLGGSHADKRIEEVALDWTVYRADGQTPMPLEELPLSRALKGEVVQDVELVQVSADGRKLPLLCNAAPIRAAAGGIVVWRDITERKAAEEALRESERRYRQLIETASEGVWQIDNEFRTIEVNDRMAQMLGCTREEVIGKPIWEYMVHDDMADARRRADNRRRGVTESYERQLRRKDGTAFWVMVSATPLRDAAGNQIGSFGMFTDITERKRAEEELAAVHRLMQDLLDNTTSMIFACDLEERFTLANAPLAALLKTTTAQLVGKRRHEFMPQADADAHEVNDQKVIAAGRAVEFEEHSDLHGRSITWLTTKFPLRDAQGRIYGVAGIVTDISERKRMEEELRRNQAQLQAVVDNIDEGIVASDLEGNLLHWNPAALAMHGFASMEEARRRLPQFADTFELSTLDGAVLPLEQWPLSRLLRGEEVRDWDIRISHLRDGWQRVFNYGGTLVRDAQGRPLLAVVTVADITDLYDTRQEAERHLRERERLSALLAEGQQIAHVGSFEYIVATQSTEWSEEEFRIYGLDPKGSSPTYQEMLANCYLPEDAALLNETFSKALSTGGVYELEHRIIRSDGEIRWVHDRAHPHFDAAGKLVRYVGATVDITERKRFEDTLRKSEEQFRVLTQNLVSAVALFNERGEIIITNKSFLRMFELAEDTDILNLNSRDWSQWQVFDEAGCLLDVDEHPVRKAMRTRMAVRDVLVAIQCPKQVARKWALISAEPILDAQGNLHRLVSTYHDITQRRLADDELRRSEARWNAVIESFAEGAIIATEDEKVIYWNPAAREMHGIARTDEHIEPLAQTPLTFELWTPDGSHRLELDEWPMRRIKRGEPVRNLELRIRRPDQGWEKVFSYSGTMVDTAGCERLIFLTCHDLTELRRAEQAMRESEERFRLMGDTIPYGAWMADADGRNIYISPLFLDLVGMTFEQVKEFGWTGKMPPEDVEPMMRRWMECVRTGRDWESELRFPSPDGQWHTILSRGKPVRDSQGNVKAWVGINLDITDRKRAEDALRLTQASVDGAAEMVAWFTPDGRVRYVNNATCRALGYTREELLQMTALDFSPGFTWEKYQAHWQEVRERKSFIVETTHRRKDGTEYPAEVLVNYVVYGGQEYLFAYGRDITERKRAEESLRESENRFRTMADSMPQLAWIAKGDGFIYWYNCGWYEYTGTTPQQMEGWGWQSVHDPELLPAVMERWKASIATGNPFEMEFPLRGADGKFRQFLTRGTPLKDAQGRVVQWFGTNTDISERAAAEEALRRTADELARSNRELEQFAYVSAHDLQEPLRQVRAYVNLLKERHSDKFEGKAAQYFGFVYDGATRMSELVSGLLAYSRVGVGGTKREPVPCNAALKTVVENLRTGIAETGARITYEDLPTVPAAPTQLTQLFQNLIANAIQYRREGVTPEIHIACRRDGRAWLFSVKDNGIGIAGEFHGKIFEIFKRLHGQEKPGTGIGLAICRKIVEHHGGRIWVESKPNEGSTFYFTIPAEKI